MRSKYRRLTSLLLAIVLIITSAFYVSAQNEERDIRVNDDYIYEVLPDDTIAILYYIGSSISVYIPSSIDGYKVKTVGDYAFYDSSVKYLTVPNGITTIKEHAFAYCQELEYATLPSTLSQVGQGVFRMCTNLKTAYFTDNTGALGEYMFYGCASLNEIILPDNITEIPKGAFGYCTNLSRVDIHYGVEKIKEYAFYSSGIEYLYLSDAITRIYEKAFANCRALYWVSSDRNYFIYIADNAFENVPATLPWEDTEPTDVCPTEGVEPGYSEPGYGSPGDDDTEPTVGDVWTDPVEPTSYSIPGDTFPGGEEPSDPGDYTDPVESSTADFEPDPTETVADPIPPVSSEPSTEPDIRPTVNTEPSTEPDGDYVTIYFEDNLDWDEVYVRCQLGENTVSTTNIKMEPCMVNEYDKTIYSARIPVETFALMFNDGIIEHRTMFTAEFADSAVYYCTNIRNKVGTMTRWEMDYYLLGEDVTHPYEDAVNSDGYYVGESTGELSDYESINSSNLNNIIRNDKQYLLDLAYNVRSIGDANGDKSLNIKDATAIMRYVAGIPVASFNSKNADVNMDAKITIADATAIQKHIANIISLF